MVGQGKCARPVRNRKTPRERGARKLKRLALAVFVAVFALTTAPGIASADVTDAKYTVQGVSPNGTTINLFDYWLTTQDGADNSDPYNANNAGINAGHSLKFRQGGSGIDNSTAGTNSNTPERPSNALINGYTGGAKPNQGLVNDTLTDGYPTLSGAKGGTRNQSLAYLFNGEEVTGKKAYANVGGLLQVDSDGYYYYNCTQNFASFDETTNSFTLYDAPAVEEGQFFPFNTAEQVFNEQGGALHNKISDADSSVLNHYFGMTMSTRFIQSEGGVIDGNNDKPVTYNFSGDDDVWVYIDGVLVGDLGGIHGATSLEINFATGDVYVYGDQNNNNEYDDQTDTLFQQTTILQCFKDAYGNDYGTGFDGSTFSDGSYHTLNFFYLERGNSASNMSLKYNLETIPESGVKKISQDNDPLGNVQFVLTPTDENYEPLAGAQTINATTDWATGELVFSYTDEASGQDRPYTLEELGNISRYWILQEDANSVPAGYRNAGTVEMRFSHAKQGDPSKGAGMLLASNQWATGAYSQARVTVTAPDTLVDTAGKTINVDSGTVFAVVMQKGANDDWYPVSGDAFSGWNVATTNDNAAIVAAAKANQNAFTVGSGGAYQVEIDNLPGNITTYQYVIDTYGANDNNDAAKYSVKYYWTNAESLDALTEGSTIDELNPSGNGNAGTSFDRVFSVMLNIPNIKNELSLVKTDAETNDPMGNVQFALYADEDQNGEADSNDALSTMTTDENGTLQVYSDTNAQILAKGSYVLEETTPDGYVDETSPIQIVVDDEGVHVNAGTADDNVTVETGIGRLVYSMKGFAAGDKVDATLHDVQAQPQTTASYPTNADWQNIDGADPIHYHYNDEGDNELIYVGTTDGVDSYTAQAGWSRLDVTQCYEHDGITNMDKQDLGDTNLSALFTGDVTIHVTNSTIPQDATLSGADNLVVTKNLVGRDWQNGDSFSFTLAADPNDETTVNAVDDGTVVLPENATDGTVKVTNTSNPKTAAFGDITFKSAGTYKFTVSEMLPEGMSTANPAKNGITYDTSVKHITVEVTAQNGTLKANVVAGALDNLTFTNTYNPDAALAGLTATKTVNDLSQGISPDLFTFQIKAVSSPDGVTAPMPSNAQNAGDGTYTVTNDVDGAINFGTFRFNEAGTYVYTVSEVPGNQTGMTYDTAQYTVKYDVVDHPETGKLLANATYYRGSEALAENAIGAEDVVFTNTYDPEDVTVDPTPGDASTGFSGTKTVTNEHGDYGTLEAGDFQFTMENVVAPDGVTAPEPSKGSTVDVAADGSFDFGTLTFSEPGTYTYEVREATGSADGVSYSSEAYTLSYTIEDQNGTLTVTDQSITNADGTAVDGSALNFENIYNDGQTEYTIGGTKVLETNGYQGASLAEGDYTFVLMDENGNEVDRVTNGQAAGNAATFQFDPITYTEAGTHTYTVYELGADGQPGTGGTDSSRVTHSDKVYTVTVTVAESNEGRGLSASADVQNADITFTNTYAPTSAVVGPNGSAKIAGTKVLNVADGSSRAMKAGEFEFLLLNGDDEVSRTTNDENGNFTFDDITFDKAGTYRYTVAEINNGLGGIAYDSTLYSVTVEVTENVDAHALEAAVSYVDNADMSKPVDAMTFTNNYAAASTTATLGVSKELQNGTLADGQFTFELTGSEGAPMPEGAADDKATAANTADGVVNFGTITFDKVGEYDYTITEVNDGQNGITYDEDATRTIHVSVTDDGEGHLAATASYGEDGSHFVNVSTTSNVPGTGENTGDGSGNGSGADNGNGDVLPQTGDNTPLALVIAGLAAIVSAVALATGAVIRRRERR